MRQDAIMEGFWIFQVSLYARFLHMQALHEIYNMSQYGWIMPNHSECTWSNLQKVLNKLLDLNMQGYEYAAVTQGAEYAWISMNMP